jgi:hypothetical protein
MRSFRTDPADYTNTGRIHPALTSFADEIVGMMARLIAYVVALALLAIGGVYLWQQLPDATAIEPSAGPSWREVTRSAPAFAVSQFDSHDKTEVYQTLRHSGGGRKDVFHWTDATKGPIARLEILRPAGESDGAGPAIAEIVARMDSSGTRELELAGIIDSKFGTVTLLRLAGGDTAQPCLGFLKRFDEPGLRISGWTCQGDGLPARRAAVSCMLNRLTLLAPGNDLKLAELFARAELRRGGCTNAAGPALSADWVTGSENPRLRGAL